jgi:dCTP deaminase
MVLIDREIQAAIHCREIIIDPVPSTEAFSSTSLDLTLASELRRWRRPTPGMQQTIRPAAPGYSYNDLAQAYTDLTTISSDGFHLEPGDFILGWTVQKIGLPIHSQLAARVEGKSSLARVGIVVHLTAPTIHAGFGTVGADTKGQPLQLEICNHGLLPVCLDAGMPICQLIFEQTLGTPAKGYSGQFRLQGPKTS